MTDEPIRIRRYPNRRLYDRSQRRYVTLGDIEELVRQGRTVEVQDSRTGEDITRQILAQILLERHPDKMELFPAALLHGLLRANDLATGFWQAYLRHTMQALEGLQRTMAPISAPMPWLSALMPGFQPPATPGADPETLARRLEELEARIGRLEGTAAPDDAGAPEAGGSPPDHRSAEAVDGLERRLRDLEQRAARR